MWKYSKTSLNTVTTSVLKPTHYNDHLFSDWLQLFLLFQLAIKQPQYKGFQRDLNSRLLNNLVSFFKCLFHLIRGNVCTFTSIYYHLPLCLSIHWNSLESSVLWLHCASTSASDCAWKRQRKTCHNVKNTKLVYSNRLLSMMALSFR